MLNLRPARGPRRRRQLAPPIVTDLRRLPRRLMISAAAVAALVPERLRDKFSRRIIFSLPPPFQPAASQADENVSAKPNQLLYVIGSGARSARSLLELSGCRVVCNARLSRRRSLAMAINCWPRMAETAREYVARDTFRCVRFMAAGVVRAGPLGRRVNA
jgi:hypothetical protein